MAQDAKIECRDLWKVFGFAPSSLFSDPAAPPTVESLATSGHIAAVRSVSLSIAPGEIFVIMGLSGSGKSTLIRCLSRLVEPTYGEVWVDGRNILDLNAEQLTALRRESFAMVFQSFALLPHDTVLDNVAFPLEIKGMPRPAREARAREMIERVGLAGRESYYPRELSGGQQQRVGIARALTINPEILFLDEPFSALDPLIRKEMQRELLKLQYDLQKTIVFITHDFDEALRLADRMAIMKDGVIIQVGTPEQVVLSPATDYVREFTKDVPRAKVLKVATLMRPCRADESPRLRVKQSETIETVAASVIDSRSDAAVIDDTGDIVGVLEQGMVIDALLNRVSPMETEKRV